jgi:hypothetical protein
MKFLLGYFNAKVKRENIFKPTIENESLHQDCNDNGVGIVKFAISKNLVVKSTMFLHPNIRKYVMISPDEKTHNQDDNILIDRRSHPNIPDVRILRGADCDTHNYLVVTKVRESLPRSKQAALKFDGEKLNCRKLNQVTGCQDASKSIKPAIC